MRADLPSVAEVEGLDRTALEVMWRRLWRSPPPRRAGTELLRRGVAHRVQVLRHGDLAPAARRRLQALAAGRPTPASARIKPGTRLVRTWNGVTHEVLVLEDGFAWAGTRMASLSAIARAVTGTSWSGPAFFGLVRRTAVSSDG